MAGSTIKTECLITAQTAGENKIAALAGEVEKLAEHAGDAAPEFAALAAELRTLDKQQSLIEQFARLKKETQDYGDSLQAVQARVAGAARALREQKAALEGMATAERATEVFARKIINLKSGGALQT